MIPRLAIIVFLNGLAVMVLEMTGSRLLAPELGSSVIVWTCIIGVIMGCMSLGYALGGKSADALLNSEEIGRTHARLSMILMAAALGSLLTALLGGLMPGFLFRLFSSPYLNALFASLCLFALPSLFCGMASSIALCLGIHGVVGAGATIGMLNAMATLGSIVGVFLGGFVLLSFFGTVNILLGVAFCLLIAAVLANPRPSAANLSPKLALTALTVAAMIFVTGYNHRVESEGITRRHPLTIETAYASLRIAQGRVAHGRESGRRLLLMLTDPGHAQSAMYIDDPITLVGDYTRYYAMAVAMNPDTKRILMLGGGSYSIPKWLLAGQSGLRSSNLKLDVVELDPGVTKAAQHYFHLPDDARLSIHHEDARAFINRGGGPYDLVFADVFNSWYAVPFHLGTRQAARAMRSLTANDGMYVMNILSAVEGDNGRLLRSIRAAFAESFEQVEIFPTQGAKGETIQNVILIAFPHRRDLPNSPEIAKMWNRRWTKPLTVIPALDDRFAPVDRYTLGYY